MMTILLGLVSFVGLMQAGCAGGFGNLVQPEDPNTASPTPTPTAANLQVTVQSGSKDHVDIVGGSSPGSAVIFRISNNGGTPSADLSGMISLSNITNFSFGSNACTSTLAAGGSCDVAVHALANNNTRYSGTLTVNVNNAPTITIAGSSSGFVLACPPGYIQVPYNWDYVTADFCVMKYEAKLQYEGSVVLDGNVSLTYDYNADYSNIVERVKYKAVTGIGGRPWVRIRRGENGAATGYGAIEACQYLNIQESVTNKYDLISNAQWQVIARNIEAQTSGPTNNWSNDSSGDTIINQGNASSSPGQSCDAAFEFIDTDCAISGNSSIYENKRTHFLSNGEVVWDISANAWEWMKDNYATTVAGGISSYWTQFDSVSYPNTQFLFGPLNLAPVICSNPAGSRACGFGYLYDVFAGTNVRGGGYGYNAGAGIFRADFDDYATSTYFEVGFRCVYLVE